MLDGSLAPVGARICGRVRAASSVVGAVILVGLLASSSPGTAADGAGELIFTNACDASAVVLGADDRLFVGNDADNVLRYYAPGGGAPTGELPVWRLTNVGENSNRNLSAIEGAARVGNTIYWIGSHARMENKGKNRPNRRKLFATRIVSGPKGEVLAPYGQAYDDLTKRLSQDPQEAAYLHLERKIRILHSEMPQLKPSLGGFNIEGLAVTKDGKGLLVALRSPAHKQQAILIPVLNPDRIVLGVADPDFGDPILLDLGGAGITSIDYVPSRDRYYIVAARYDSERDFSLYTWSGDATEAPELIGPIEPPDFAAQAIAVSADGRRLLMLSDDGDHRTEMPRSECLRPKRLGEKTEERFECQCTWRKDVGSRSFRGKWIDLD